MLWKGGYAVLKVVIADDEARILSLIRLLPDWDALGIEVAGTAGNGSGRISSSPTSACRAARGSN